MPSSSRICNTVAGMWRTTYQWETSKLRDDTDASLSETWSAEMIRQPSASSVRFGEEALAVATLGDSFADEDSMDWAANKVTGSIVIRDRTDTDRQSASRKLQY